MTSQLKILQTILTIMPIERMLPHVFFRMEKLANLKVVLF